MSIINIWKILTLLPWYGSQVTRKLPFGENWRPDVFGFPNCATRLHPSVSTTCTLEIEQIHQNEVAIKKAFTRFMSTG